MSPPYAHKGAAAAASPEVRTLKAEFDMVAGEESPADEAPDGQGADKSASARATSLSANRKTAMSPQSQMEMVRAASSDDSPPASTPASQQGDGASGSSFVGSRRRGAKLLSAARKVRAVRRSTQKSPLQCCRDYAARLAAALCSRSARRAHPRREAASRVAHVRGTSVAPPTKRPKSRSGSRGRSRPRRALLRWPRSWPRTANCVRGCSRPPLAAALSTPRPFKSDWRLPGPSCPPRLLVAMAMRARCASRTRTAEAN